MVIFENCHATTHRPFDASTMLPQADAQVLKANPDFARLYKDLAANKLNTDGSSQIVDPKEAEARAAFATELHNTLVELARKSLLSEGLRHVAYNIRELPDEVLYQDQLIRFLQADAHYLSFKTLSALFLQVSRADWTQQTTTSSTQRHKSFKRRLIRLRDLSQSTTIRSLHHLQELLFPHKMIKRRPTMILKVAYGHCWKAQSV